MTHEGGYKGGMGSEIERYYRGGGRAASAIWVIRGGSWWCCGVGFAMVLVFYVEG